VSPRALRKETGIEVVSMFWGMQKPVHHIAREKNNHLTET